MRASIDTYLLSDSRIIGVPSIDKQHRELVEFLLRFHEDRGASIASESVTDTISSLLPAMVKHFATEEEFMNLCGMPTQQVSDHVIQHTKILEELTQINIDSMINHSITVADVLNLAKNWILDHVDEFDVEISKYAQILPNKEASAVD